MRHVFSRSNLLAIALLALGVGCSSTQTQKQSKENLLIAAGFQVIAPKTAVQQQKLQANFTVRTPVPTYFGSNHYTIDSDFGVFEADGNQMLMRRVAEINAIAKLQAMSQTKEFTQAAEAPLQVAQGSGH